MYFWKRYSYFSNFININYSSFYASITYFSIHTTITKSVNGSQCLKYFSAVQSIINIDKELLSRIRSNNNLLFGINLISFFFWVKHKFIPKWYNSNYFISLKFYFISLKFNFISFKLLLLLFHFVTIPLNIFDVFILKLKFLIIFITFCELIFLNLFFIHNNTQIISNLTPKIKQLDTSKIKNILIVFRLLIKLVFLFDSYSQYFKYYKLISFQFTKLTNKISKI